MKAFIFWLPLVLVGCGGAQKCSAGLTGDLYYRCSHSGVEYVLTEDDLELSVDAYGKPVSCKP